MSRSPLAELTRLFAGAIVAPPLLTDLGVDYLRRTIASVLGILIVLGIFLPRALFAKYADLDAIPYREPYVRALHADTLMMIAIPMLIVGLLAVIVSPLLFPDDVDYQVLTPLPITRVQLFVAKLLAVAGVVLVAVVAVNLITSVWFPVATIGRGRLRATHPLLLRIGAHAVASMLGSVWTVGAVMAGQGVCLTLLPAAWRRTGGLALQAATFVMLLLSLPFVTSIPSMRVSPETVVSSMLIWLPPVWFMGLEQTLLDGGQAGGYRTAAGLAITMIAIVVGILAAVYARLYVSAERLAHVSSAASQRPARPWTLVSRLAPPKAAVASFIGAGLSRSRLHQFIFLLIVACGAALLVGQTIGVIQGVTAFARRPRAAVSLAVGAPLLVALCTTLGLRAAFRLPLDRGAAWLFRVTEDPQLRPLTLDAIWWAVGLFSVLPSLAVAIAVQPLILGSSWLVCASLTMVANLLLVELALLNWRRIPYACTYLPGKRHLAYNLGLLLAYYFVFIVIGGNLIRWSLLHPSRTLTLAGILIAAWAAARRSRLRTWGLAPLEFEDEDPLAVGTLGLLSDERNVARPPA